MNASPGILRAQYAKAGMSAQQTKQRYGDYECKPASDCRELLTSRPYRRAINWTPALRRTKQTYSDKQPLLLQTHVPKQGCCMPVDLSRSAEAAPEKPHPQSYKARSQHPCVR
jgi:hypothetical protein